MEHYTKIENKILKKLSSGEFSGSDFRILIVVLRKTNGYQKVTDWISFTQFEKMTGLSRKSVAKSIDRLTRARALVTKGKPKVVTKWKPRRLKPLYGLNKNVDEWISDKKNLVTKCTKFGYQTFPNLVTKWKPTKESITKENIQKKRVTEVTRKKPNPELNELIEYFREKLGTSLDGTVKSNRQYGWNLLRKIRKDYPDKNAVKAIKTLIDVGLRDSFHARNLTGFKYLFYNTQKIIQSFKSKTSKLIVIEDK